MEEWQRHGLVDGEHAGPSSVTKSRGAVHEDRRRTAQLTAVQAAVRGRLVRSSLARLRNEYAAILHSIEGEGQHLHWEGMASLIPAFRPRESPRASLLSKQDNEVAFHDTQHAVLEGDALYPDGSRSREAEAQAENERRTDDDSIGRAGVFSLDAELLGETGPAEEDDGALTASREHQNLLAGSVDEDTDHSDVVSVSSLSEEDHDHSEDNRAGRQAQAASSHSYAEADGGSADRFEARSSFAQHPPRRDMVTSPLPQTDGTTQDEDKCRTAASSHVEREAAEAESRHQSGDLYQAAQAAPCDFVGSLPTTREGLLALQSQLARELAWTAQALRLRMELCHSKKRLHQGCAAFDVSSGASATRIEHLDQ